MAPDKLKQRILREVSARGLTSYMNRTKWLELQAAVRNELPFPPPYQRKDLLLGEPEPVSFDKDVWYIGDWSEGILPFETIEWIRIRPRYIRLPPAVAVETIADCEAALKDVLHRHAIHHEEHAGGIWIYGYR